MALIGILVLLALWLVCAATALYMASRLAHPDDGRTWHLHKRRPHRR
jgi:hypothetical protein